MSIYDVIGSTAYRGHDPGTQFEATLDPLAEARAIRRGAIRLVERSTPGLVEGTYKLPKRSTKKRAAKRA